MKILREKICRKCDFYKEDEEDSELECYAYKTIKRLLEEKKINLEDIY